MAWMLPLKVLSISIAFFFMVLGLKISVPLLMDFSLTYLPLMWTFFLSCLKPPYLYVIVNCIIITIAASSRFHHAAKNDTQQSPPSRALPSQSEFLDPPPAYEPIREVTVCKEKTVPVDDNEEKKQTDEMESVLTPNKMMELQEIPPEKPIKASAEGGRTLKVTEPQQHETLENTWKAITEGRGKALMKCETWENHSLDLDVGPTEPTAMMKKSETFRDRTKYQLACAGTGKVKKEPSLGKEELNRRVEAFINKFNEEMRLQRQQSLQQYMEMIHQGSH